VKVNGFEENGRDAGREEKVREEVILWVLRIREERTGA
jgi:hypothetical protein